MTGSTHAICGLCVGLLLGQGSPPITVIGLATTGLVGGLFPDIDQPGSKIGSRAKVASRAAHIVAGHRGLFHSPLLYVFLYLVLPKLLPSETEIIRCFVYGCASHLLLDMTNRKGIPLLYPMKKHMHIGDLKMNGLGEKVVRAFLSVSAIILLVKNIVPAFG